MERWTCGPGVCVRVSAPVKTVLGWGGTLGRGAEPPTALRVPHRQLPTAPVWVHLDGLNAENTFFAADYTLYNCVCDK